MNAKRRLIVLVLPLLALTGCGTMGTAVFSTDPSGNPLKFAPYSGTKVDLDSIGALWLDVPFSLVADTVMLPVTIPLAASRQSDRKPTKTDGAVAPKPEIAPMPAKPMEGSEMTAEKSGQSAIR